MTNSNCIDNGLANAPLPALWPRGHTTYLPKPKRIPLPTSLRLPVTPANRAKLRELRNAEEAAWISGSAASGKMALHRQVQQTLAQERSEGRMLAGIAGVALVAVAAGLSLSIDFVAHWATVTQVIHQLIG